MSSLDDDIHRTKTRNAEILECRRQVQHWSQRLKELEAEQRKVFLLASFEYNPERVWVALSEEERQEKVFIMKAIANNKLPIIPTRQLLDDKDIILALARGSGNILGVVPRIGRNLQDDKEVMLALCRKHDYYLFDASARLKDDKDVVMAALGSSATLSSYNPIHEASHRLKGDTDIILAGVKRSEHEDLSVLLQQHVRVRAEDEKQVAMAVLEHLKTVGSNRHEANCMDFMKYFSDSVRDDENTMQKYVEYSWRSLEFCSDRLKRCEPIVKAAVLQNLVALEFSSGPYKDRFASRVKRGLSYEDLPPDLKSDNEAMLLAVRTGSLMFGDVPLAQRQNKAFVLKVVKACPHEDIYEWLPYDLQTNEEFCVEMLQQGLSKYNVVFEMNPSLYSSRDAVMAAIAAFDVNQRASFQGRLHDVIDESPFQDDEEIIMLACEKCGSCIQLASERLATSGEFILKVQSRRQSAQFMGDLSHEFWLHNVDIILKAIELDHYGDFGSIDLFVDFARSPGLHDPKSIVLACLKKGWPAFNEYFSRNPFHDDAEVVRLAVKNYPSQLKCASTQLKEDSEFVFSLVSHNGEALLYADESLRRDDKILTAATAHSAKVIVDCFHPGSSDDFAFLEAFAARLRSKLELHDSFIVFLCGIAMVRPNNAPALRCYLPRLDRGPETTIVFKKLIAEYLEVPIGEEFRQISAAFMNLQKLGF